MLGWALSVCVIALATLGFRVFYAQTIQTPVEGGRYTEGVIGQPVFANPLIAGSNEADLDLVELLFSDLFALAEKVQPTEDHKTWTVSLKDDLAWSDGTPLTADDVIFTIDAIKGAETRSPLQPMWKGIVVDRLGERELRFTLKTPYAFFEDNLRDLKIVPQHIFGAIPYANFRLSTYNLEPVGSGPYLFEKYDKRKDGFITAYHLAANPRFVGGKPLIQGFTFRFFATLEEALAAFNRKEIDGLGGFGYRDLPKLKIGHLVDSFSMPRYYAIFMNPAISTPLKSAEVRRALNRAIDKERIVTQVFGNFATAMEGPFPPQFLASTTANTFDPEEAERLLDEAGWTKGGDGMRRKTAGKETTPLQFELVAPRIQFLLEAAEAVKQNWQRIGVQVSLIVLDPAEIAAEPIKTRGYQMLLFGNILRRNPDVFSFWHSTERFYPGLNLSLYENKTADALLESIRKEFDAPTRNALLEDFVRTIVADQPAIFLFSPQYLYAHLKNLGGLEDNPLATPADRFRHINAWFLKTTRIFQ